MTLTWSRAFLAVGLVAAAGVAFVGMSTLGDALDREGASPSSKEILGIVAAPVPGPPVQTHPKSGENRAPNQGVAGIHTESVAGSTETGDEAVEGEGESSEGSAVEPAQSEEGGGASPSPPKSTPPPAPPKEDPPIDYYPGQ